MATEIKVPVLPESVADATIAAWHKKVGDSVSRDENIVDLETDKVVLEVPSTVDGVIKELKFEEGDTVTSQQLLAIIEEGAAAEAPKAESGSGDKQAPAAGDEEVQSKSSAKAADDKAPTSTKPQPASSSSTDDLPPGARFTARSEGIDPSQVEGTGRRGAVTKEDLVNYAAGKSAGVSGGHRPEERVPMTRIRKRIAERLMHS
ncbi:MAG: dihydrolipoamide succinyltransferase, partial [Gammaproteobacteria bacterium]|nr:dihydrolipoamide succinyltransferase [Gammaproteobacteria bacterium]